MLVDTAFGSAQIARAGARGLGVVVWSLCKVFNYVSGHLHEVEQAEAVHDKLE